MNNCCNNIIYILDFDGVICDSIDECMLTTYNSFKDTNIINISDVPNHFRKYFYEYRYHVRPAKEYFLLCRAFAENIDLSTSNFEEFRKLYENEMNNFESIFFQKRFELKKNIELWLSYHKIYEHANQFISSITDRIFILTTKDYDSVNILASHFGFIKKIEDIYSREISSDKAILFENLFKKHKSLLNSKRIVFVDDNEFHLASVSQFPIQLYFASWGYAKTQKFNKFKEISSFMEII